MSIENSKNVNTGNLHTGGGDVRIGDNFYKSAEYQELKERREELEDLLATTTDEAKRLKYSQRLNTLNQQIEEFKKEVIALAKIFERIELDTERLQKAKAHFDQGEYKAARAVLDATAMTQELEALLKQKETLAAANKENEEQLKNKADEFLILARLTAINYEIEDRFGQAIHYFKQSLQAYRNVGNLFAYALFLQGHNQNNRATPIYQEALEMYRGLATVDPEAHLPNVATTLNNLAILQKARNEYDQAEVAYREALEIYRRLSTENSQTYLPDVATTLNNLAILQSARNEYDQAEVAYREALEIYRKLSVENPETYLPDVAMTLNNLAILQSNRNEYDQAEAAYREALEIRRKLSVENPETYLPDVGMTLNNLAILQKVRNEYDQAEAAYREALEIRRKLSIENPETYLPDVATTLNNLANLQSARNENDQAEAAYREALEIYRKLSTENPQTYLPDVATTLNNLATLQSNRNENDQAEGTYHEALEIYQKLAVINPQTYLPYLGGTQINISLFYQISKNDKERSMQLVDEAITNLLPFHHLPYIQNYLKVAFNVLRDWDIDVKAYLEKKLAADDNEHTD